MADQNFKSRPIQIKITNWEFFESRISNPEYKYPNSK